MRLQQYELIRPIGHGGMGLVFEGRKLSPIQGPSSGREHEAVAIKLIPPRDLQVEEQHAAQLFQREAVFSWRISGEHENLVTTYDYGVSSQGYRYLVLELVNGVSLSELITGHERLPFPVIRRIVIDVLCGLYHLHRRKVIHRDVSSANVLLARDGTVKVTDFGLIKPAFQSGSDCFRGTPKYASPEAFLNQRLGPVADLYSVGVLLYRMVTGRYPYGETFESIAALLEHCKAPVPAVEDVPEDLATLIAGLLPLRAGERFWVRANDVLAFIDEQAEPVALSEQIAEIIEVRSPAAERHSAPASLPELGWPFSEPESGVLGPAHAPQQPIPPPPQASRRMRWLPWTLVPLAFVAGAAMLAVLGSQADQPHQDATVGKSPSVSAEVSKQASPSGSHHAPTNLQASTVSEPVGEPATAQRDVSVEAPPAVVPKKKTKRKPPKAKRSRFIRRVHRQRSRRH